MSHREPHPGLLEKAGVFAMLSLFAALYYSDTLGNWFISDDAAALISTALSFQEIFFGRHISYAFYTPLVAASFKPEAALFGIAPVPYHIHNTALLVLLSFLVYRILRLSTGLFSAFVPAVIVLVATPSLVTLLWLVLRTYLYGALFSLLVIYFFLKHRSDPQGHRLLLIVLLVLTELSFMAKEQFMTLPLVLFLLAGGPLKERARKTWPFFAVLTLHFLLRMYILGGLGGYLGASYDPGAYLKAVSGSIPALSTILFGYSWFFVIVALPLLRKPAVLGMSLLLWLTAQVISFLVMHTAPAADTYRYWQIALLLGAFLIGLSLESVQRRPAKALLCLAVMLPFLLHTAAVNREIKTLFSQESGVAEQISRALIDDRYSRSIVFYPQNISVVASSYIENMANAYKLLEGREVLSPFYPVALLAAYPEIVRAFSGVFEFQGASIVPVKDVEEKLRSFRERTLPSKPLLGLDKSGRGVEMTLRCDQRKEIFVYEISRVRGRQLTGMSVAPYVERLDIAPFVKSRNVELVPLGQLAFRGDRWTIDNGPELKDSDSLFLLSCVGQDMRQSQFSDIIYVERSGRTP